MAVDGEVPPEQRVVEQGLVDAVVASFDACPDPRLKELMVSLVRHLHAFIREVRLTEREWTAAIDFLTRAGHITDDVRQEFILLSDTLGASMQTINVNNQAYEGATEATVFGPFFVADSPAIEAGGDLSFGAPGEPCWVEGTVTGTDGKPLAGARIEVWEADEDGLYDVQHAGIDRAQARGVLVADAEGRYHFRSILAMPYAIPHDGPVGDLLKAAGRHPWRPAHLHFMIKAPGYETLITHVFRSDDAYLDSDAVFGVRQSLIADWKQQPDGSYLVEYDFVLNPAR